MSAMTAFLGEYCMARLKGLWKPPLAFLFAGRPCPGKVLRALWSSACLRIQAKGLAAQLPKPASEAPPGLPGLSLGGGGFPGVCHDSLPGSKMLKKSLEAPLSLPFPLIPDIAKVRIRTNANIKIQNTQASNKCDLCRPLGASEIGVCICADLAMYNVQPATSSSSVVREKTSRSNLKTVKKAVEASAFSGNIVGKYKRRCARTSSCTSLQCPPESLSNQGRVS